MSEMTLASLFDGSGGFPLAAAQNGIKTLWNCEVEPFPIIVTHKRMPSVKHYGDVSAINGAEVEPVDIITFGSPCQDLSIAGRRAGLEDGERSNLFYQAVRIIKEMRDATNGKYPRYAVWENVPGALSSNQGRDFQSVLKSLCEVKHETDVPQSKWQGAGLIMGDDYSVAWRILDAQYWGVPQRRRRIFLVADFDGQSAGKILFESEGVRRNPCEVRETGQETTSAVRRGDQEAYRVFENHQQDARYRELPRVSESVNCQYGTGGNNQPIVVNVLNDQGGGVISCTTDTTATLRAQGHWHPPVVYGFSQDAYDKYSENDVSATLGVDRGVYGGGSETLITQTIAIEGNGSRPTNRGDGYRESNVMYTINTIEQHTIAYGVDRGGYNQGANAKIPPTICKELMPTMIAKGPNVVCQLRVADRS